MHIIWTASVRSSPQNSRHSTMQEMTLVYSRGNERDKWWLCPSCDLCLSLSLSTCVFGMEYGKQDRKGDREGSMITSHPTSLNHVVTLTVQIVPTTFKDFQEWQVTLWVDEYRAPVKGDLFSHKIWTRECWIRQLPFLPFLSQCVCFLWSQKDHSK